MLDCEEVFGESIIATVIVMPTMEYDGHRYPRPHWFFNLMPTRFCPRTCLQEVKNSIYFNNNDDYSGLPPHMLPCWPDWDMM